MSSTFSIIIPSLNGSHTLGQLITDIYTYSADFNIEIIIIDSGSSKTTLTLLKQLQQYHTNLKIIHIDKNEFNHGQTRNLGVQQAKGTYVCFFSQDVSFTTPDMFTRLLSDFKENDKVVAVFGKQIPYEETSFIQKLETVRDYEILDQYCTRGKLLFDLNKPFIPYIQDNYFLWYFMSNVCACYKREYLLKHPFLKTGHGEDILLGKNIIENGFIKIYDSQIQVRHSHIYNYVEYYKREKKEVTFILSTLNLKKKINAWRKVKRIWTLNISFYKKIYFLIDLLIYYVIKTVILLEVVVLRKFVKR